MNIEDVSNPDVVLKRAKGYVEMMSKYILQFIETKGYMIIHPIIGEKIHFGPSLYQDYTIHGDDTRRQMYIKRNHKWKNAEPYTSAHASYFLLW
jgi:hypothetical protein